MTKRLFEEKKFPIIFLLLLLLFQFVYCLRFPAVGSSESWLPISAYLPKFKVESLDNFLLGKISPLISPDYRLCSDIGDYLELARDFTPEYFKDRVLSARPLYPFLIFLASLPFRLFTIPSYGLIFILAILVNFLLLGLAVIFFFFLLRKLFSFRVAFLSSVLVIFSPFVRASLIQPMPEMLMVFAVVVTAGLLYSYIKKPSTFKLVVYSLIIGVFLLGKMFFAISFFILLLALYFKRYREGLIFLAVHLIPIFFWYFWETQVWHIPYYVQEVQVWNVGIWLLNIPNLPWYETAKILLSALPKFIEVLIRGFLLVPVIFSVIGFQVWNLKQKNIFYFGALFSLFLLIFGMNLYFGRHAFLTFPIIYPTAILGIERVANFLKKYNPWFYPSFYVAIIGLIIIISNLNVYKIFENQY